MAATQLEVVAQRDSGDGVRQLAVLNRIARIATEDIELRPMLQRIVDALHEHFGWEFIACASVDRGRNRFVCEALHSTLPSEVQIGYSRALGSGVVGEVALTGQTLDLDDIQSHENFVDTLHGTRAELCVPVRHQGEVIAVLNAESLRPGAFRGQRALLETVAEQIGGVIAIARLHAELGRRADLFRLASELSRAALEVESFEHTLERIATFIHSRFELEICGIFMASNDGQLILRARAGACLPQHPVAHNRPVERGIALRAYRTGETQLVPDVALDTDYLPGSARVQSELAVPIRLQGRLLGVINMESASAESFAGDNPAMLEALAAQVAGAIHLAGSARRLAEMNRLLEQRTLELQSANAQLRQANTALEELSQRDGLTGLANRRRFDALFEHHWNLAHEQQRPLALLLVDIDHFKLYNDGYGHLDGDVALRRVAATLAASLADIGAVVARFGGEEFAVLVPDVDSSRGLELAERMRAAVIDLGMPHAHSLLQVLSVSVGVASQVPADRSAANALTAAADRALYQAKREGRNRVVADATPD
jgi:diguanylate cyclase (GGDEF)-like protein